MLSVHIPPGTMSDSGPNAAAPWINTPPCKPEEKADHKARVWLLPDPPPCWPKTRSPWLHIFWLTRRKVGRHLPYDLGGVNLSTLPTCYGLEILCLSHEHSRVSQGIREPCMPGTVPGSGPSEMSCSQGLWHGPFGNNEKVSKGTGGKKAEIKNRGIGDSRSPVIFFTIENQKKKVQIKPILNSFLCS